MVTRLAASLLAQLAEEGCPTSASTLEEAMRLDHEEVSALLARAQGAGHVRPLRRMPGARIGPRTLYELTDAGALEASGGAQLTIDGRSYRPPVHAQPALF